jgi:hypothetical protein
MKRYTIFFIIVNALHVSGGFYAHHQELKNCTHSIGYMSSLLAATASVGELELVCMRCWMCIHIQQCIQTSVYTSNNAYKPVYTHPTMHTNQCIHIQQRIQTSVYTSNNAYKPVLI